MLAQHPRHHHVAAYHVLFPAIHFMKVIMSVRIRSGGGTE